jgi:hypothetical protein
MSLEIRIPPEMEQDVRERASAAGEDVQTFVIKVVQASLVAPNTAPQQGTPEWRAEFKAWVEGHPKIEHEVDDSRESIYDDRGL